MRLDDLHEGDVYTYSDFKKRKAAAMPDRRSEQEKYDDAFAKQQGSEQDSFPGAVDVNDCPWCGAENNDCDCLDNKLRSTFDDEFDETITPTNWSRHGGEDGAKQIKNDKQILASIDLKRYGDQDAIYITSLFVFGKDRHARRLINDLILEFPQKRIFINVKDDQQAKFIRRSYHVSDQGELNVMESLVEGAKMAWARKGKTIVRKFRCTSGRRKGRIVSKPNQCTAAIDLKKRASFKRTKARLGSRMARKAKKTKRINPASRRLKSLNKRR